jgi:hypothetical protein
MPLLPSKGNAKTFKIQEIQGQTLSHCRLQFSDCDYRFEYQDRGVNE